MNKTIPNLVSYVVKHVTYGKDTLSYFRLFRCHVQWLL